jgi:O-antigen biosynthesis protein
MTKKYIYEIKMADENAPASKIMNFVGHDKDVLEVGCASGIQSKILKEQLLCRVTGIEIDPEAADDAKEYCDDVIIENVEQIDFKKIFHGRKFDVILFADVLEHLRNPGKILKEIRHLLKDDGYVVASIPNIVHGSVIYQMMKGEFDYKEYGLLDDTHIRFFTIKNIYGTFEKAGYVISNIDRVFRPVNETEFNVIIATDEDKNILNYMNKNNSESETYQFVIKAYPTMTPGNSMNSLLQRINELVILIDQQQTLIDQQKIFIDKIKKGMWWNVRKIIKKLFNK